MISMIRVGGHEGLRLDFEIPGRHGVRQTMADTMGIGSIFRALCTIPALLGLARDLHEVAPGAWLYNYTNPMAALVWAIYAGYVVVLALVFLGYLQPSFMLDLATRIYLCF